MCRRWRAVGRGSAALWEAVGWAGSGDPALQVASLRAFLAWLCSRAAPPRQLCLHFVLEMPYFQRSAGPAAETWVLLGAVVAHCAPRLERLTILQASRAARALVRPSNRSTHLCQLPASCACTPMHGRPSLPGTQ